MYRETVFCLNNMFQTHCSFIVYLQLCDGVIISVTSIQSKVLTLVRRMLFAVCTWLRNISVRSATSAFLCVFFKMTDFSDVCVCVFCSQSVCQSLSQSLLDTVSLEYGNNSLFIALRMQSMSKCKAETCPGCTRKK